jgi:hypothetical protein
MSRLVARILLAILMLPAAMLVYLVTILFCEGAFHFRGEAELLVSGVVTWMFVAMYWWLLWRRSIAWTARRTTLTTFSILLAIFISFLLGCFVELLSREMGYFVGSVFAPLVWLILVTIAWRETFAERAARIQASNKLGVVCPSCGYNLTGLQGTRCPECGTLYTVDEIIAGQPARMEDVSD